MGSVFLTEPGAVATALNWPTDPVGPFVESLINLFSPPNRHGALFNLRE